MSRVKKKKRLHLEMNESTRERLEQLSDEAGCSLAEMLRRAFAVYSTLRAETKDGAKVIIRSDAGAEKELVMI